MCFLESSDIADEMEDVDHVVEDLFEVASDRSFHETHPDGLRLNIFHNYQLHRLQRFIVDRFGLMSYMAQFLQTGALDYGERNGWAMQGAEVGDEQASHIRPEHVALNKHKLAALFLLLLPFQESLHNENSDQDFQGNGRKMKEKFDVGQLLDEHEQGRGGEEQGINTDVFRRFHNHSPLDKC